MHYLSSAPRWLKTMLLLAGIASLSACATMSSPIDEAYNTGGANFSIAGGYTRTIFSTNNF